MADTILAPLYAAMPSERVRLAGGWRQRLRAVEATPDRGRSRSPHRRSGRSSVAEGHLLDWAEGRTSASRVFFHMRRYYHDHTIDCNPLCNRLAHIGSSTSDANCGPNLAMLLDKCGLSAMVTPVPGGGQITSVLKPSTVIKLLHGRNRNLFRRVFGTPESIRGCWEGLFASTQGKELRSLHPFLSELTLDQLARVIPISIHEDGVP